MKIGRKESNEINRNGRTALLINVEEKQVHLNSTPTWLTDPSADNKSSHINYSSILIWILLVQTNV